MARERFITWNPKGETLDLLGQIKGVLAEYAKMDIRLTLRQLYYQLVSRDIIPNQQREYKKIGNILANARLAGIVDWEAIEDRIRTPDRHSQWDSVQDLVKSAIAAYRLPRWKDQANYVEVWCEKDALRSVLEPLTNEYHVTLMVNRGYSSISAMYDAAQRVTDAMQDGKRPHILYIGDLDPSGEDMVRDIRDRMRLLRADGSHDLPADGDDDDDVKDWPMFSDPKTGERLELEVTKLALTPEQVRRYRPPPNPAKQTDSRFQRFADKHGTSSYEVDALPPQVLMALVRGAIESHLDMDLYRAWIAREEKEKLKLIKAAKTIKEGDDAVGNGH